MKIKYKWSFKPKYILGLAPVLWLFLTGINSLGEIKEPKSKQVDLEKGEPTVRKVFTGQKLFVVEVTGKNDSTVNFKAENRDAFQVVSYLQDTSSIVLDWTMCPNGKCPVAELYYEGSAEDKKLNSLVKKLIKEAAAKKS